MSKKEQAEADRRRAAHRDKWRAARAARAGWSRADHEAESERIAAEIAAMVESGAVTVCPPPGWGEPTSAGSADVANIMAGWVITPTQ